MFLDEATITVQGGDGGRGCIGWRREKYEPMGGPDGGDGGDGGDVIIEANVNTDTLSNFVSRKKFTAKTGAQGSGNDRGGRGGEELRLFVPPGTLVFTLEDGQKTLTADLRHAGDTISIAKGGRGGYGNGHFVSSTRQAPDFAEKGEPGEQRIVHLELKLVADVGIIGYPNVGKSTLIAAISSARPKIANYPFTTLTPNLGVVTIADRSIVVCDIPGLIEGASEGKGLGHAFLRHIERCGLLLHLLDLSRAMDTDGSIDAKKLAQDYLAIRKELIAYSPTLAAKREVVAISKADLTIEDLSPVLKQLKKLKVPVQYVISAATGHGVKPLLEELLPVVLEERVRQLPTEEEAETESLPVLRPEKRANTMGAYRIETQGDEAHITGKRLEQFTAMTDFASEGGRERFLDVLQKIGLRKEITKLRNGGATKIFIGKIRVDVHL